MRHRRYLATLIAVFSVFAAAGPAAAVVVNPPDDEGDPPDAVGWEASAALSIEQVVQAAEDYWYPRKGGSPPCGELMVDVKAHPLIDYGEYLWGAAFEEECIIWVDAYIATRTRKFCMVVVHEFGHMYNEPDWYGDWNRHLLMYGGTKDWLPEAVPPECARHLQPAIRLRAKAARLRPLCTRRPPGCRDRVRSLYVRARAHGW
jgi:hypothetical protein